MPHQCKHDVILGFPGKQDTLYFHVLSMTLCCTNLQHYSETPQIRVRNIAFGKNVYPNYKGTTSPVSVEWQNCYENMLLRQENVGNYL